VDGLAGMVHLDSQLVVFMLERAVPVILTGNAKNFNGIDAIRPIKPFG